MEPKRELSGVDLAALDAELGRYVGAKVDKAYLYPAEDLLRLRMRHFDHGRVEFLAQVGDVKRAHVADPAGVPDAPERPPNFAMMLRNRIAGADLVDVSQYEFDRILVLEFERSDDATTLVIELFGDGNVAVLDEAGEVVDSLYTVRLKSRTVAPGAPYEFPESRVNPLAVPYEEFVARMEESTSDVVRTLATRLNLGGRYAEEVCTRAGVEKGLSIGAADDATYEALYDALARLAEDVRGGGFDPRVYTEDGRVVDVAPFPLEDAERAGLDAEPTDTFTMAVDEYFRRLDRDGGEEEVESAGSDRPDFEAEIAKEERIIEQQEAAIEGFEEEAERERERAERLYANYDLVDEVLSTVRAAREEGTSWDEIEETLATGAERGVPAAEAVTDVDPESGRVTVDLDGLAIPVDPAEGVEKNADRLYTEAKRIEEKKAGAQEAIAETRERLEAVERRREEWEDGEADEGDDEDEGGVEEKAVDWLSRSSVPLRTDEHWYERFRWFHTSDDFLVIGGRDAEGNEEIVKKYMESADRFFHSQAHGGPATVLKATGPSEPARDVEIPAASREEAARFAVSYSSVWKDGRYAGDAYMVTPDQVSKTPESGEYIEKGGFVIRGERSYFRDVPAEIAVGIQVDPETRVIGGPPSAVEPRAATSIRLRPGRYAQNDAAKRCYRVLRERFADESFVRKVASPDRIQEFLPPGGSEMVDD